jgi:hypothetical protein
MADRNNSKGLSLAFDGDIYLMCAKNSVLCLCNLYNVKFKFYHFSILACLKLFLRFWKISFSVCRFSMLGGSLVTTAWRVLRLWMEETPPGMEGSCKYIE